MYRLFNTWTFDIDVIPTAFSGLSHYSAWIASLDYYLSNIKHRQPVIIKPTNKGRKIKCKIAIT